MSDHNVGGQIGALKNHVVLYRPAGSPPLDEPQGFQCWAEDGDHAEEQCLNAYPQADVLWVWQGEFGLGMRPALEDYYSTGIAESDSALDEAPPRENSRG